ncbi:hypothetical protein SteCoe_21257 [Stentor coeruleus]|uniref:Uncharacterized protein n=1 Tax=Stentor coeruleus TaxID=5963 RepID=A0A1R2BQ59_9CILI|nr:hypothetical protein SteCoe_21257 [Stentor coeruleus]
MSYRSKSGHTSKKNSISPKKQMAALRNSLKKYEADLRTFQSTKASNSPISKRKHYKKTFKPQNIRSQVTPFLSSRGDYEEIEHSDSYVSSNKSFSKSTVFEPEESWDQKTLETPEIERIRYEARDSVDSDDLNESDQEFVRSLKKSRTRMEMDNSSECENKVSSRTPLIFTTQEPENPTKYTRELRLELQKQKQSLAKKYQQALERQREALQQEFQQEFESMREDLIKDFRKNQKKLLLNKEKELEKHHRQEIDCLQKRHELQLNTKINEVISEYERLSSRTQEELIYLRKHNENLKRKLEDSLAKTQLLKSPSRIDSLTTNTTIDQSKQLSEIYKSYNKLQQDYIELKQKQNSTLCTMCKAFTQTNSELEGKMSRIRAYIDKSPLRQ